MLLPVPPTRSSRPSRVAWSLILTGTPEVSGRITASKDTTLLFTVPADQGWSASLNGEAILLTPSLGFLTIPIPPGEHEFVFPLFHPGLNIGLLLSCLGLGLIIWRFRSGQPRKIR